MLRTNKASIISVREPTPHDQISGTASLKIETQSSIINSSEEEEQANVALEASEPSKELVQLPMADETASAESVSDLNLEKLC